MKKTSPQSTLAQFGINFVIPIIILTRFSGEDQLGATYGLLLALAFPVAFELYNVRKHRKLSVVSALAIGGILVTGAIGLLGLSEDWLAVRRSLPSLIVGMAILVSILMDRSLVALFLPQMLDMEKVNTVAAKKRVSPHLALRIRRAGFALSGVLFVMAIASYVLTRVVITGETGTTTFNQEYARLRLWSIVAITVPFFAGITGVILYLARSIEKLTGLDIDKISKKG